MAKKKATKKTTAKKTASKKAVRKKTAGKKSAAPTKKKASTSTRKKTTARDATASKEAASQSAATDASSVDIAAESAASRQDAGQAAPPKKKSALAEPPVFKLDEKNDALIPDVEQETQSIGDWLQQHNKRRQPSIFERRWWDDRILSWAMADESVKVQMFRFVDVLPMLKDHQAVSRHLQEYFEEVDEHLPSAVRMVVDHAGPNTVLGRALSMNARK